MTVKSTDILSIIELFKESNWDELHLDMDGLHLFLSTQPGARLTTGFEAPHAAPSVAAPVQQSAAPSASANPAPAAEKAAAAPLGEIPDNWVAVKAPNLGTFYRAPKPGSAPFVEIGQSVSADTEICLLEVMKLFTAVKAGVNGVVRRICVEDAELVEGEQILFYVERA